MAFLFDNKATVAYAAIITVWSALFLPAWDVAEYQFQVKKKFNQEKNYCYY